MDKYQSHKIVQAAKITRIEQSPADEVAPVDSQGTWRIHWENAAGIIGDFQTVTHVWYNKHQPVVGGYLVRYFDGYMSFSPAEPFESGNTLIADTLGGSGSTEGSTRVKSGMRFGVVLDMLHASKKARRPHWADNSFIYLVNGSKFTVNRAPLNVIYPEGTEVNYSPHIDIHHFNHESGDHHCMVWDMPQIDVLADDWQVLAV